MKRCTAKLLLLKRRMQRTIDIIDLNASLGLLSLEKLRNEEVFKEFQRQALINSNEGNNYRMIKLKVFLTFQDCTFLLEIWGMLDKCPRI